ncbi:membrane protein insertase YidC [bacterium]|nr:membrane protein insertase YidC [bacterium]
MNSIVKIFYIIFYQPLFNLLILLTTYLPGHSFGLAIIILTLLIRAALYPFQEKVIKSQIALQKIQPKIKEIQEKHKYDREKQAKALMEIYKKEKFNPFSGFWLLLIQFPVLIALYRLFLRGLNPENFTYLYSFVHKPETINTIFLNIDLAKPSILLAVLVGVSQYLQTKWMSVRSSSKDKQQKHQQLMMNYFLSAFIVIVLLKVPSAVALYLLVSGLFAILQQEIVKRRIKN